MQLHMEVKLEQNCFYRSWYTSFVRLLGRESYFNTFDVATVTVWRVPPAARDSNFLCVGVGVGGAGGA